MEMTLEFMKELVESEESIKAKSLPTLFGSYEDMGFRHFQPIRFGNGIALSVQACYAMYCSPRKTMGVEYYKSMELAILRNGEFSSVAEVTNDLELIDAIEKFSDGTVYGYVPVLLIDMLYQELKRQEQESIK